MYVITRDAGSFTTVVWQIVDIWKNKWWKTNDKRHLTAQMRKDIINGSRVKYAREKRKKEGHIYKIQNVCCKTQENTK